MPTISLAAHAAAGPPPRMPLTWPAAAEETRCCTKCQESKPLDQFRKKANAKSGIETACRTCRSAQERARYWSDVEKERARLRVTASPRQREIRRAIDARRQLDPRRKVARAAHRAVHAALRRGELVRPDVCQAHGCDCTTRLQAHHHQYELQLDVAWLCQPCHSTVHRVGSLPLKPGASRLLATAPEHARPRAVVTAPKRTRPRVAMPKQIEMFAIAA